MAPRSPKCPSFGMTTPNCIALARPPARPPHRGAGWCPRGGRRRRGSGARGGGPGSGRTSPGGWCSARPHDEIVRAPASTAPGGSGRRGGSSRPRSTTLSSGRRPTRWFMNEPRRNSALRPVSGWMRTRVADAREGHHHLRVVLGAEQLLDRVGRHAEAQVELEGVAVPCITGRAKSYARVEAQPQRVAAGGRCHLHAQGTRSSAAGHERDVGVPAVRLGGLSSRSSRTTNQFGSGLGRGSMLPTFRAPKCAANASCCCSSW